MILTGKCLKCWEINLFQCHVAHQKSHTYWSGIEPRTRRCLPIIGQFLLVCCYFRPLKPKCLSLHTLLKNLQPKFFPLCKGPSQTHKTTRKIIFLYILNFIFLVTNGKIKYWGENTSSYIKLPSGRPIFILHFTKILLQKLFTFLLPSVVPVM
jgi:hypothetical protein